MWNNGFQFNFTVNNVKLWYPKNHGKPNLYKTQVELLYKNNTVDTYELNVGIRTAELDVSDSSERGIGDFCLKVNGERIFVLGTNWVPLDAFHSQDEKGLTRRLKCSAI